MSLLMLRLRKIFARIVALVVRIYRKDRFARLSWGVQEIVVKNYAVDLVKSWGRVLRCKFLAKLEVILDKFAREQKQFRTKCDACLAVRVKAIRVKIMVGAQVLLPDN